MRGCPKFRGKLATLGTHSLRDSGSFRNGFLRNIGHRRQQQRNLTMADHSSELSFGNQQARANPTLDLIAGLSAFHVAANRLDDGEGGFDHIGTAQSPAELIGDAELVHGESFLQTFF